MKVVTKVIQYKVNDFLLTFEPIENSIEIIEEDNKYIVKYLVHDDVAENPFIDRDGIGKIIFHPNARYECNDGDYEKAAITKYSMPLDAYIHSGISLSIHGKGIQCRFDTSSNIAIWIPDEYTKEHIESGTPTEKEIAERTNKCAEEACTLYNQYANVETFGCIIEVYDKDKNNIDHDAIWGFFGYDNAFEELKSIEGPEFTIRKNGINKYFTYDPENNEFETYATLEEQSKAAKEIIEGYLDDVWSEEVEGVVSGVITEKATKCGVIDRPKELDEEGHDEDGRYWPEQYAYICDYEMKII